MNEKVEDNWITEKDTLVRFFHDQITNAKNHGILSSIALLKEVQKSEYEEQIKGVLGIAGKFQDILDDIFIPSALAIALHDKKVWQELKKKDLGIDLKELAERTISNSKYNLKALKWQNR